MPTKLKVNPKSAKIADRQAYELKFSDGDLALTDLETLLRPRAQVGTKTWLALSEPVRQEQIDKRVCGTLYIEYATNKKSGLHSVRV